MIFDSVPVFLVLVWGRSAIIMPTSRPGSEPVEFWVDGSRRDGTVEEFYTLSSELGRSGPHYGGQGKTDEFIWTLHWAKVACMRGPCDPSGLTLATLYNPSRGLQTYSFE